VADAARAAFHAECQVGGTTQDIAAPERRRAGQIRLSRTVLAVGVALVLAIAAATAATVLYLRGEALADAERRIAALSSVLATQTDRHIHTTDFVLLATVDRLRSLNRLPGSSEPTVADHELQAFLAVQVAANPQVRALRVIAPDGFVRYASDGYVGASLSAADTSYLAVHSRGAAEGLYISEPQPHLTAPDREGAPRTFVLARRIDGAGGGFAGVVMAEMETRYFLELFRAADLSASGAVALLRRDGILLTMEPYRDAYIGRSLAHDDGFGHPLFGLPLVPERPVTSWRALSGYPLVLSVAMAERAALAGWRQQALMFGGGGLATIALFALMIGLLAARFAHEERLTAALRTSEQRFRDIAESSSDWIWEMGADLRFSYFSDRVFDMTGTQAADVLGKTREEIADPDDLAKPEWQAHLDDLHHHRPFRGFNYTHRRADGTLRRFRVSGTPVYDERGVFCGYRGTGTDVTAEHEAEARARLAQERLRDAVEFMPDGFVLYDAEDRLVLCNSSYRELHAETPEALQPGMPYGDILRAAYRSGELRAPDGDVEAAIRRRLERHRNPREPFDVVSRGRVLRIAERRTSDGGIVGIHTDITDLKSREVALIDAKQAADAANRAKSEFLANMSHELRTPLNAIIGFAETIERGLFGDAPPKYVEYARDIRSSGEHLLAVISDILDMSKIESGKYEFHEEPVSLPDVVASCVLMVRHQANERGVALTMPDPIPDLWLHADRRAVTQVALNLLSNAVKFTEAGGEVAVAFTITADEVAFAVRDTGVGIAPEILPRLFEPFSRGSAATSRRADGTGLGLTITKKLMERHGGRIDIRSRPGEGTTATAVFPASRRIVVVEGVNLAS
jgi:PAS domain S-box-containing protein